jgi:hypothetical protein
MLSTALVLRLAQRLHAAWQSHTVRIPHPAGAWRDLDARTEQAHRARHRLRLASEHRLRLIVPRLATELAARLDELARQVDQLRLEYTPRRCNAPDLGAWVAEIRQLQAEFRALTVDWRQCTIRAVTDPVVLRDVRLGPFAVVFAWGRALRFPGGQCFDLVALEPNPAGGRPDVTHPHVHDGVLRAGDATAPLERAVAEGRLAEAFLLVRSVLSAYNPHSPYVPLEEWDGVTCSDCGCQVDPEDRYTCEACESDMCDDCLASCAASSDPRCAGCLEPCAVCRADYCPTCLEGTNSGRAICPDCRAACKGCGAVMTTAELTAASRLCPTCEQEQEEGEVEAPKEEVTDIPRPEEIPSDAT